MCVFNVAKCLDELKISLKISHLELSLEHDLAAVGDDVSALPARDALLQLAQLVQTLLPGLAAGTVPGAAALSVEFFNFVIAVLQYI